MNQVRVGWWVLVCWICGTKKGVQSLLCVRFQLKMAVVARGVDSICTFGMRPLVLWVNKAKSVYVRESVCVKRSTSNLLYCVCVCVCVSVRYLGGSIGPAMGIYRAELRRGTLCGAATKRGGAQGRRVSTHKGEMSIGLGATGAKQQRKEEKKRKQSNTQILFDRSQRREGVFGEDEEGERERRDRSGIEPWSCGMKHKGI
ncbi:hypothetical protein BGZ63DRAFT_124455 [Mariannaea sp. PMI_226]|nr:hypothetical protein BGZ63DRAFT_124455 [Mariannaea sp. PMI_226]